MAESETVPGSTEHTVTLQTAAIEAGGVGENVTEGTAVPLGGRLHKAVIDPRLKPGTRAYRDALLKLRGRMTAAEDEPEPLEPEGDPDPEPPAETILPPGDQRVVVTDDPEAEADDPEADDEADPETVTVEEEVAEMSHAELDEYIDEIHDERPTGWASMPLADKRTWLVENDPGGDA